VTSVAKRAGGHLNENGRSGVVSSNVASGIDDIIHGVSNGVCEIMMAINSINGEKYSGSNVLAVWLSQKGV